MTRCDCPMRQHDLHRADCRHVGGVMTTVPNKPKTPLKSFRIPQDLYEKSQRRAEERGESLSHAVRKFLERYSR